MNLDQSAVNINRHFAFNVPNNSFRDIGGKEDDIVSLFFISREVLSKEQKERSALGISHQSKPVVGLV